MLTYKVDGNALITYYQDGKPVPDVWPWGTKAEAEDYAKRLCDKYNSPTENPDGIKYPNKIKTAEEKAEEAGLILPK